MGSEMCIRDRQNASSTIDRMPATHLTHPDGSRIFPVERRSPTRPNDLRLDSAYLWAFGSLSVPVHLWRAMQRYAVWIEPALVEEWIALSQKYANTQERTLDATVLRASMDWQEPQRDAADAKRRASRLLERQPLYCVWTGGKLSHKSLDIDHCFPWSAWPCGDLWNLMPANRRVNQQQKRNLLPADETLRQAKERIIDWWHEGYCNQPALDERFRLEATARLPAIGSSVDLENLFAAVAFQRLRLRSDQQIPEWGGPN